MKYVWSYIAVFFVNMLAAYGIFFFIPDCRNWLLVEDSAVENLSALFYLGAFLVGIPLSIKSKEYRKTILLVSFTGLLGFLDELSFGERILATKMPRLLGVQIDAAHDFFYVVAITVDRAPRMYAVALLLVALVLFIWVMHKYGRKVAGKVCQTYPGSVIVLAVVFVVQLMIALVIDLGVLGYDVLFVLEEQLEMNAAIALIFCCLNLHDAGSKKCIQRDVS